MVPADRTLCELDLGPIGFPPGRSLLFAISLAVFALLFWRYRFVVMDDPFITFRYAKNLLRGEGWVFNPGQPVEGYSNFLWVLLSVIPIGLKVEPLGAMRVLNVLLVTGMFWLFCFGIAGRWTSPEGRPLGRFPLAAVLAASSYPVAVWAGGGLETILHSLLILFAVLLGARALSRPGPFTPYSFGLLILLIALSRPEGAMFAVLPVAVIFFGRAEHRRAGVKALLLFTAGYLIYTVWRYVTFGTLVPTTVSAKVGGNPVVSVWRGLGYVWGYFSGAPVLLLLFAAWALFRSLRGSKSKSHKSEEDWLVLLGSLAIALQLSFTIAVGGDWMPGMRFLVPMLPLLCVLASLRLARFPGFVAGVVCAFLILSAPFLARRERVEGWRALEWCRRNAGGERLTAPLARIGKDLNVMLEQDATLALTEAGVIPYYARVRVIDMLGLTDPEIAAVGGGLHQAFDGDLVLDRRPDYVLLGITVVEEGEERAVWGPDQQILGSPRFAASYSEVHRWPRPMPLVPSMNSVPGWMVLYERAGDAD